MALLLREYQIGYRCGFYDVGRPCGCRSCELSAEAQSALDGYENLPIDDSESTVVANEFGDALEAIAAIFNFKCTAPEMVKRLEDVAKERSQLRIWKDDAVTEFKKHERVFREQGEELTCLQKRPLKFAERCFLAGCEAANPQIGCSTSHSLWWGSQLKRSLIEDDLPTSGLPAVESASTQPRE